MFRFLDCVAVHEAEDHKMSTDSLGNDLDSEKLLQDNSDVSGHNDVDEYLIHRRIESRQIRRYKFASIILVTLLIATNFGWWWWAGAHHNVPHVSHVPHSEEHQMGPPKLDYCKLLVLVLKREALTSRIQSSTKKIQKRYYTHSSTIGLILSGSNGAMISTGMEMYSKFSGGCELPPSFQTLNVATL